MPLNKMQFERIEARINSAKRDYIQAKHSAPPPDVTEYTVQEKTEMIRTGAAKLKGDCTADNYVNLGGAFTYPLTGAMVAAQSASTEWLAARRVVTDKASAIAERLMDMAALEKDGMAALDRIAEAFKT